ncbi:MAG TPA: prepilin-type N-terminal cleavage/methylation domain-containing protein [Solirubrobacteraceae bacterium]|jgi:prepilin-type N-terminal cleavage/methylation domain-containing protein|nr:prepilin-type N-terminal cleavage/methylation domain-containing protein [Solirubrobacteraceae bacterium]
MRWLRLSFRRLRDERGFTLIELLVAMSLGIIVSGVALSLLNFTTADVTRITERVHADQTGRVALEKLMLALHSSCLTAKSDPIKPESTTSKLRFVSETSAENEHGEPSAALPTIKLHEVIYTGGSGKIEGTLTEKSWTSKGVPPSYEFNEKETPTTHTLLTGIEQTENAKKEILPVFRYYRYYRETDSKAVLGELDPTPVVSGSEKLNEKEAIDIAKVNVNFTALPEGKENRINTELGGGRPVPLEDSAILRLSPSSEESGSNLPCAEL